MDAALLAMISTLFVAMLGNSWQQSRENSKTRDLMIQLNNDTRTELKDLGTELRADHKALGDELRSGLKDLGDELRSEIKVLGFGLGDVRERLARIEGHLGIGITRPPDETAADE